MPNRNKTLNTVILAVLISLFPGLGQAQDQAMVIKYRQSIMKAIGGHMGAISTNAKANLGHGADAAIHARSLHSLLKMIPAAFGTRTDGGKTRAKAKIWEDRDGFRTVTGNAEKAAADLLAALDAGQTPIGPKLKALGKSCGGCHKKFRSKKKK